ncbi:MAG TPA: T9SS type A sorting domain-containing protein [Bacteroidia bacterium]|jgi:hypothetical protein|nr:T9SS type A sorting domain-containing protein [Bacteroidia bacterium]
MKKFILTFLVLFFFFSAFTQNWYPVGSGVPVVANGIGLFTFNGKLYVGGNYFSGGYPCAYLYTWNDTTWSNTTFPIGGKGTSAGPMTQYKNNLIVGAWNSPNNNVEQWNDTVWSGIGTGALAPTTFAVYNGKLYLGSNPGFEVYNDTLWKTPDSSSIGNVNILATYNGKLYAGGYFQTASGKPASNIAVWNDTTWMPVGKGINYYVNALAVYNGKLYAGGEFDSAGGKPAKYLAVWNDTVWAPMNGTINFIDTIGYGVYNLYVANGNLYVGGFFDSAGGKPAHNVAMWDGTLWHALGTGINNGPGSFAWYDSNLYVCGPFDSAGGKPAQNIAIWGTNPLTVNEIKTTNEEIQVFPNPSNGVFQLITGNEQVGIKNTAEIYNMLGEKIYQSTLTQANIHIDISNYSSGIYLYCLVSEKGELIGSGKLIIQ